MVPADSHRISRVPRYSGYHDGVQNFVYGALTLFGLTFQINSTHFVFLHTIVVLQPQECRNITWFGLLPIRSPLLGESLLFSFPEGTKMFQFPSFASSACTDDVQPSVERVIPFGNPWVKGHLHLTTAYRSLSRPSSPP